jgi:hypothetical protein
MTKRNITVTVTGDDIQDFRFNSSYTEELMEDLRETHKINPEFTLIECTFEAALDELREKLGK